MKCANCQSENREGAKFCQGCGSRLDLTCPSCGYPYKPGARFCDECGKALGEHAGARPIDYSIPQSYTPKFLVEKILTSKSAMEGERKLVTVLFADVAGFTSLSEKLDPEEVHQIMDACFKILMDEIHRYEGTINQFTGDGVMALFGAPVAHEDHAQRACHAGLAIQRAMAGYGHRVNKDYGVDFRMRIGLNSGPVIVGRIGDDLRMDYTAVGDTTNLAARVQQEATPGEVWMSREARNLVKGYFAEELAAEISLKGKSAPQALYRVTAELPEVRTRFEAGLGRGVAKLVGRRSEMEALRLAFQKTKDGEAQVIDVVGEAGVGKSRLVYEFQTGLGSDAAFLMGVCLHHGRNINFLPVRDVVKTAFGVRDGMYEEEVGKRIVEQAQGSLAAFVPFYRNLLSLGAQDPLFNALNPEGRKYGTFDAVKNLLLDMSKVKPLVVFLEDVHWMDKISEEFFTYFSRCIHGNPVMMLAAYRPEGSPSWAQGALYQKLGLETLGLNSSIRLVMNLLGGLELEPALEGKIAEKAGGNPFFMEEIIRELLERGALVREGNRYLCGRPIDQLQIPGTIQGVIAARMDRLSEELKRTMQVASVIGRDFAFRLLKSIMELGEELRGQLTNLVGLEVLYEKALYPELEYIFKHALTQEVAYESLLKHRRREIHGRIAGAIEDIYADQLEKHYELLAHHYEQSGDSEKAIKYLVLAGEKSNRQCSLQTACEFFRKAMILTESSREPLDPQSESRVHHGMAEASFGIGDVDVALDGFRKAVETARRHGMIEEEMESLTWLVMTAAHSSLESEKAMDIFEQGIERAKQLGQEGVLGACLNSKAVYLRNLGHLYQGYLLVCEAEPLVMSTGDIRRILPNRFVRAVFERWLGNPREAIDLTEGGLDTARKIFNFSALPLMLSIRGVALAEAGRIDDSISVLQEGIEVSEKFGALFHLPAAYNSLGYCYGEIHAPERARIFNLRSEEMALKMMRYPMGRVGAGECLAQARVNLMENLFDQGDLDEAWTRLKSFEQESRGKDYERRRDRWEARMKCLEAEVLLQRNEVGLAEAIVTSNLDRWRKEHARKLEGRFRRLLGEVEVRRGNFESAITSMGSAVKILKEVGNPRQLWQAHASLATVYERIGRRAEACEQWGTAAEVIRKQADGLSDRHLRETLLNARQIREILPKAGV